MRAKLLPLAALAACANLASANPATETVSATVPVEVLAVDPALASGGIPIEPGWVAPRIAMQPARAARGVVLEKKNEVLVLALLEPIGVTPAGQALLDAPASQIAWCELPGLISNLVTCYQDLDADQKFELSRIGMLGVAEVLGLSRLQAPKSIEPRPYRAAREDELPRFQVGYRSCGPTLMLPQTFDGDFRFETAVRRAEGVQWPKPGRCDNIAKVLEVLPDGGKLLQMGRFKVEVRDDRENEFSTRLTEGIPPGTLLAHVRSTWPLTDATDRPAEAGDISGDTSFLVVVGTPTIAASAKAGEEIFSAEVRHRLTGRLANESLPRLKRDKITLPSGTPLYGIAMTSSQAPYFDPQVVWCTPVKQPDGELQPHCFAPTPASTSLVRAYSTAFTVTGVSLQPAPSRNPPIVERGPVDFGAPLVLSIRIDKADKKHVAIVCSLAPRGSRIDDAIDLRRAKDDAGFALLGDLLLKIKPAADGQTFEITSIGELRDGGALDLPRDAARLR